MFKIIEFEELKSTNKFALENIKNLEANSIIRAKIQTNGRGRFTRTWVSDKPNNCYISFVLKPDIAYRASFQNLTQYLSIVLCEELSTYEIAPAIKWPNDVLVNGKKIAGILSEVSFSDSEFNGIVLGIGVNLNLEADDFAQISIPATSLNIEAKKNIDADVFINNLATRFFERYYRLLQEGFVTFRARYLSLSNFIGKEVIIKNPEPTNLGVAINVCEDGMLEILTQEGKVEKIISGDLILRG